MCLHLSLIFLLPCHVNFEEHSIMPALTEVIEKGGMEKTEEREGSTKRDIGGELATDSMC